jgi:uncharacterized protein (DUF1697 family)
MKENYLVLLRGINVGGKNIIKMADLKRCFESIGFTGVGTFIQSGNVLFCSKISDRKKIAAKIQKKLREEFNYEQPIVIITANELSDIIERSPAGFGKDPARFRYDIVFLVEPLTAKQAIKLVPLKEGVDKIYAGKNVLYFSRLVSKVSQSRMSRIISLPEYKQMTIRNWNTTAKLYTLIRERLK